MDGTNVQRNFIRARPGGAIVNESGASWFVDFDSGFVAAAGDPPARFRNDGLLEVVDLRLDELDNQGTFILHAVQSGPPTRAEVDRVEQLQGDRLTGGRWDLAGVLAIGDAAGALPPIRQNEANLVLRGDAASLANLDLQSRFVNLGFFELDDGKDLTFADDFFNASLPGGPAGVVRLARGSVLETDRFVMEAGSDLGGRGEVRGQTIEAQAGAHLQGGRSPGVLTFTGQRDLQAGSVVETELGGLLVDQEYDRIHVEGTALVASLFEISFLDLDPVDGVDDPFRPADGDVFDVLVARQIVDQGLALDVLGAPAGLSFAWDVVPFDAAHEALRLTARVPEPGRVLLLLLLGLALRLGPGRLSRRAPPAAARAAACRSCRCR